MNAKSTATLLLLGLAAALRAQDAPPTGLAFDPAALDRINVRLEVVNAAPALPQLPLLLRVIVSNASPQDVVIPEPKLSERDQPYNTLDILCERPGRDATPRRVLHVLPTFRPWKSGLPPERPALLRLGAGKSWTKDFRLSHDWEGENPQPILQSGQLRLWAELCSVARDAKGLLVVQRGQSKKSPPITVNVPKPAGADATALADLLSRERPWLLCAPEAAEFVTHGDDFAFFEGFSQRHRQSRYAPYARTLLAHMHAVGDRNDLHPSRPPNTVRAMELLDEASRSPQYLLPADTVRLKNRLTAPPAVKTPK